MKNQANDRVNIPLTDTMRIDITSMIADLMELQKRGTYKVYGLSGSLAHDLEIFSLRCAVGNLIDEDDELEEELR